VSALLGGGWTSRLSGYDVGVDDLHMGLCVFQSELCPCRHVRLGKSRFAGNISSFFSAILSP
jgi:hypothetical protein